jgi:hypothetical protein
MSKIAEKKALEAYPILFSERNGHDNSFKDRRESYIKGYNQAMQDFLEKAEDAISMIGNHCVGEDYSFDQIWEQFKNYMEEEL